jgi:uncharacterized small protein (TIGR04563 family)
LANDKRKQSLYFPEEQLAAIEREAKRLQRSLSWIVQRCVKVGISEIMRMPSVDEPADVEAAE